MLLLTATLLGCPAPDCMETIDEALLPVKTRWPTLGDALDDPRDPECVWQLTHREVSVDGMGVTVVNFDGPLNLGSAGGFGIEQPHDLFAGENPRYPSLLFFDQTEGPRDTWPLIGVGYHYDYFPCNQPSLGCVDPAEFFVHEAGYHRVFPGQDGGMDIVTQSDLDYTLDDCSIIEHHDLDKRLFRVRHGRVWDLHIWFDPEDGTPEGGPPVAAIEDPWLRWKDAPDSVVIEDAFFFPETSECGCLQ
ncbi:MAG: hypothetical protein VX899_09625 [Myxococcota bacterium]|nr:hypothetical protein [Myxococcota bacterium]